MSRNPKALVQGLGHVQTDTPEFKRWFRQSKVVDAEGLPRVVYHGTSADITEFCPKKVGSRHIDVMRDLSDADMDPTAFYFTSDMEAANWYAKDSAEQDKGEANVLHVYLSMQNPLVVDFQGTGIEFLAEELELAKSGGYDGLIAENFDDGGVADHYIVFSPEQIKSATGNLGTFFPDSPDIRFSGARSYRNWERAR
jgi:hypothetical protein